MTKLSMAKCLAAALIGASYYYLGALFWAHIGPESPAVRWALEALAAQGHRVSYYLFVGTHDLLVNTVLAVPVAMGFAAFRGWNHWSYVTVAVVAAVLTSFWGVAPTALVRLFDSPWFWFGFATTLFSLPIAFAATRAVWKTASPSS